MSAKQYNLIIFIISLVVMLFLGLSGLGFVPIGKHLSVDFLIVPAIIAAIVTNYRYSFLLGLSWGAITLVSPGYLPEYYPLIAAVIPRILTTMFAAWLFKTKFDRWVKDKLSLNINFTKFLIVISIFHIVVEVFTNHFFNIYIHYGYDFSYNIYLFKLIVQKTVPEILFLTVLTFVLGKKFEIILENGNCRDVRIKSK
jgi:uncharacterized membrane protein